MNVSIRSMIDEAVKRLEILGVPKMVIKDFKDDSIDRRYICDHTAAVPYFYGDGPFEDWEFLCALEQRMNSIVYLVVREHRDDYVRDVYFTVGDDDYFWDENVKSLKNGEVVAFVRYWKAEYGTEPPWDDFEVVYFKKGKNKTIVLV